MKIAVMGIDCHDPEQTWSRLSGLPPVDLLVLPELSFMPWLCATPDVQPERWDAAVAGQELERLSQLPARVIVGTAGTTQDGRRYNDGFVWSEADGLRMAHRKTFLPDEPGFWEATWYDRGPVEFVAVDTPVGRIGFSICTEMWFTHGTHTDVDIVVVPRATPAQTTEKWLAGGATLAVCNGAFCVSSNRAEQTAGTTMGATGWIFDPEGTQIARTDVDHEVVIADVDLEEARLAKNTYPRYVAIGHPDSD